MLPNNVILRTFISTVVFIGALFAVYFAGQTDGYRTAMEKAEREKTEIVEIYQSAAYVAEVQYGEKLAEANAEKQKWFDFAQSQSVKLAAAIREIDRKTMQLQEQIPHAVQKDGGAFTGIGPDGLRRYNQALGYADN